MITILLAGILALPSLLCLVVSAIVVGILSLPSLSLLLYRPTATTTTEQGSTRQINHNNNNNNSNTTTKYHVIITGGSSGIGLSIAKQCVQQGMHKVTILARNPQRLQSAKIGLEQVQQEQQQYTTTTTTATNTAAATTTSKQNTTIIQAIAVSVSDYNAMAKVAQELCGSTATTTDATTTTTTPTKDAPTTMTTLPMTSDKIILFHCAGICHTTYFEQIDPSTYYELVQTNQLGAMYTTRAFLPYMTTTTTKATTTRSTTTTTSSSRSSTATTTTTPKSTNIAATARNTTGGGGTIVFCSSAAGQVGAFGYCAYAPTKFALRGFAETLHMEYSHDPNIHFQIAFPIDTDTPGYQSELATMPEETKAMNDAAGLACPDEYVKIYTATRTKTKMKRNERNKPFFGDNGIIITITTPHCVVVWFFSLSLSCLTFFFSRPLVYLTNPLRQQHRTAKKMIQEALAPHPRFAVYFSFEGWMLCALTAGMSPVSTLIDAVTQVALMGLFRLISLFYLNDFWRILRNIQQAKQKTTSTMAVEVGEASLTTTTNNNNNEEEEKNVGVMNAKESTTTSSTSTSIGIGGSSSISDSPATES
jgi:3-dehydrosphinganine reductase